MCVCMCVCVWVCLRMCVSVCVCVTECVSVTVYFRPLYFRQLFKSECINSYDNGYFCIILYVKRDFSKEQSK